MRSKLGSVSGLIVAAAVFATAGCVGQQKKPVVSSADQFVVMTLDPVAREGGLAGCLVAYINAGLAVEAALAQCKFAPPIVRRSDPLNPSGMPASNGRSDPGAISASCRTHGWNPAAEESPARERQDRAYDNLEAKWKAYDRAAAATKAAEANLREAIKAAGDNLAGAKAAEKKAGDELNDAAKAASIADDDVSKEEKEAQGEEKKTPNTGSKKQEGRQGVQSVCEEVADFIAGCNSNGWKSPECSRVLALSERCGDPFITDPAPGEEVSCKYPAVSPEEVRRVIVIMCRKLSRPAPGEDPCKPTGVEGTLTRYVINSGAPPCGDPRAMTGEEQCLATISLMRFGYKSLQDIADAAREKLGGPLFIVPKPPAPGPGPKTVI